MPLREKFEEYSYYHVYNRGLHKQTLFHRRKDFERFVWYINRYAEKCKDEFDVLAYCLLPNHFHFVFHNKAKWRKISYFIGNICASYTRYYYNRYGVDKGRIYFESRFKCKVIDDPEYLQQCLYYVENNPIKHGIVANIEEREYKYTDLNNYHPGENEENSNLEADLE